MKTTLELPDALLNEVERRARHDGQSLNEAVADLLRKALAAKDEPLARAKKSAIAVDLETGLPYVECSADAPARSMSVSQLIALEHEALGQEDRGRIGLSH